MSVETAPEAQASLAQPPDIQAPTPAPAPVQAPAAGRARRRRTLALAIGAGLVLLTAISLLAVYLMTRQPVSDLPGVQQLARALPPRRLFSFAGMADPVGVAVSPDGQRIFVSEGGGDRLIKVFDRDGRPLRQLSAPGSTPGTRRPGHLAVDGDGRLFVVERMRAAVDVYAPSPAGSLEWVGMWQPPALASLGGWLPNGIGFGLDGRVYIADVGPAEHRILTFTKDGDLLGSVDRASGVPGGLNYPVQAIADEDGRVYVSDGNAGRVLVVGPRGASALANGGDAAVGLPRGLAIGGGRLFVADAATQRVVVFSLDDQPQFLHAFGDEDTDQGLAYPNAVAVDRTGRVYVADRANQRVQVWSY